VLRLAAEASVSMQGVAVPRLAERLEAASAEIAARREPSLRAYQGWFEIYEPLLAARGR
jgi:hypothetical protein